MPIDPDAVVAATLACPGVARMYPGVVGEVATYLPGRRVPGVRLPGHEVEVHVVARWGEPLPEIAERVRAAVRPLAAPLPVAVYVDDVDDPATPGLPGVSADRSGGPA